MQSNREIYQCAKLLLDKYGDNGAIDHCNQRIESHNDDTNAADVWKGIRIAVKHLLDGAPGPEEIIN